MSTIQIESSQLPLARLFNSPSARVLDFLLTNQKFDYAESDISKLAGIPPRTLQRVLPFLVTEAIVRRTRKSGKAFMYEANKDSERTKALLQYVIATRNENLQRAESFPRPILKQK